MRTHYAWQDSPQYREPPPASTVRPYRVKISPPKPAPKARPAQAEIPEQTSSAQAERREIGRELMAELNPDVPEQVREWWVQDALDAAGQPTVEELHPGRVIVERHYPEFLKDTVEKTLRHRNGVEIARKDPEPGTTGTRRGAIDYSESNRRHREKAAAQRQLHLEVEPYDTRDGHYLSPQAARELSAQEEAVEL